MKFKVMAAALLIAIAAVYYFMDATESGGDEVQIEVSEASGSRSEKEAGIKDSNCTEENVKEVEGPEAPAEYENMFIDVDGAVKKPGIVRLPEGSRVFEAVELAGGLSSDADTSSVNMASELNDGEKIYIPGKTETKGTTAALRNGMININTADFEILQNLNGVGPATAERIIQHRNAYGKFNKIEDIKNVSGIGDKTFEKFKTQICVK